MSLKPRDSMSHKEIKFVFFGGEPLGVPVLNALEAAGLLPTLVVCNPDRPVGRKQILTPPPVKVWAQERDITVFQPTSYKVKEALDVLTNEHYDLFVVVAYNFILPEWLIALPAHQTINLHPSLLPAFRGASPIRSAILADARTTGVTVMLLDKEMDHGPILAQETVEIPETEWPVPGPTLDTTLAMLGGQLLAKTIPAWVAGEIEPTEQDHDAATYCGRITKDMAELALDPYELPTGPDARAAYLKIQAYAGWPVAFFMHEGKRYKVTQAHLEDDRLIIDTIIPEGKNETLFSQLFA